jgi:hypothetical protein
MEDELPEQALGAGVIHREQAHDSASRSARPSSP